MSYQIPVKNRMRKTAGQKAAGKAKLQRASAMVARRGPAPQVRQAQYSAAVRSAFGSGRDNKTFDPVTIGSNNLQCSTDSAVAVSASGYVTNASSAHVLNQVPQGTSSTTRIGRKILMKGVLLQGRIVQGPTNASSNIVRLCLIYIPRLDRSTTTMAPQNVIWTAQDPSALRVINNSDRFRVIRQWTYKLTGDLDAASTGFEILHFSEYVKLDLQTSWLQANTDGTFNDMEEGALCLYAQGINTVASNNSCPCAYAARVYFEDV